jgi:hypothetical protein
MHNTMLPRTAGDTQEPQVSCDAARCAAATLYLMSHYAQRPCPLLAHAIADQLKHLSGNCASGTFQLLQSLAMALLPRWQHIAGGNTGAMRH